MYLPLLTTCDNDQMYFMSKASLSTGAVPLRVVETLNRLAIPVKMHVPKGLGPKRAGAVFFRSLHSILIHTAN